MLALMNVCCKFIFRHYSMRTSHAFKQSKGFESVLAVAECGSVTDAAERLALTQSGVGCQIAAIEEDVGFPLLDRNRRRLSVSRNRVSSPLNISIRWFPQRPLWVTTGRSSR